MKTYSGSTSNGFLPTMASAHGAAALTIAPEPGDPSTFADALAQEQTTAPIATTSVWMPMSAEASSTDATGLTGLMPIEPPAVALAPALQNTEFPATSLGAQTPDRSTSCTFIASATVTLASPITAPSNIDVDAPVDSDVSLPHYIWLGQPKAPATGITPSAPTPVTLASDDAPPSKPAVAPIFTLPSFAKTLSPALEGPATHASSSAGPLTNPARVATVSAPNAATALSQFLMQSQQPTLPTPAAIAHPMIGVRDDAKPAASFQDQEVKGDPSPTQFVWLGQPKTTSTKTATTPTPSTVPVSQIALSHDSTDLTGAAIVSSVLASAPTDLSAVKNAIPAARSSAAHTSPAPRMTTTALPLLPAGSPLATIMAHAAILAASSNSEPAGTSVISQTVSGTSLLTNAAPQNVFTLAASTTPLATQIGLTAKPTIISSGLEKKSPVPIAERSSLPTSTETNSTVGTMTELMPVATAASTNGVANQPVVTTPLNSSKTFAEVPAAPIISAGMTNDKKQSDMTSTLEMQTLFVSSGTHPLVTRTDADLHIQLGTNADFHHALDQVMHVAELSHLSRVTPPLRVAIEIQTPPGAIVNVYVSRQSDSSYRAQLSTNDAQALSWVQDQVSSLKGTTDTGTAIRWSPAQLEVGATSTAGAGSSGSDRDLDWNRGGQQGQSAYDQDERPSRRYVYEQEEEAESLGFFDAVSAVGGAA